VGDESKEFMRYKRQREQQEKQEEELFTRAPVTKRDKQIEKTDAETNAWVCHKFQTV
jgi:U3 small nucleolar ribonucleoprotein protein LCP5